MIPKLAALSCTAILFAIVGFFFTVRESAFLNELDRLQSPSASAGSSYRPPVEAITEASPPEKSSSPATEGPRDFVERWFASTNTAKSPADVLEFYAPRVQYFDRGIVSKDQIAKDKANFFRRWPLREYVVNGDIAVGPASRSGEREVHFDYVYAVSDRKQTRHGRGAVELKVRDIGGRFAIVSEAEG
jgi:hypothetical protein